MWEIQHGHCMPPTINDHTSYISYSCHGVSKIGLFLLLVVLYTLDFFQITTPCLQIYRYGSAQLVTVSWIDEPLNAHPPPPLAPPLPPTHTHTHTWLCVTSLRRDIAHMVNSYTQLFKWEHTHSAAVQIFCFQVTANYKKDGFKKQEKQLVSDRGITKELHLCPL